MALAKITSVRLTEEMLAKIERERVKYGLKSVTQVIYMAIDRLAGPKLFKTPVGWLTEEEADIEAEKAYQKAFGQKKIEQK